MFMFKLMFPLMLLEGVVDFPFGSTKITAGEFSTDMLTQDTHVKEGEP